MKRKMKKYKYSLDLQLFNDDVPAMPEPGVEEVPAAEEQTSEPQVEDKADAAFAKKLSVERKKWESERDSEVQKVRDEYKDHETYKKATEYLQKTSGIQDVMSLKEQIELAELQERAEEENLPPEVLKRLDKLEEKAARGDELEEQVAQEKASQEFENNLKSFCDGKEIDGKPLDHKELWNYMAENETSNPNLAFKAMKADLLEAQVADAKKTGVKEYLNSKTGVKTNSGAPAGSLPQGGGWKGAEERALARIRASQT